MVKFELTIENHVQVCLCIYNELLKSQFSSTQLVNFMAFPVKIFVILISAFAKKIHLSGSNDLMIIGLVCLFQINDYLILVVEDHLQDCSSGLIFTN